MNTPYEDLANAIILRAVRIIARRSRFIEHPYPAMHFGKKKHSSLLSL
jgi:hypothetical protein